MKKIILVASFITAGLFAGAQAKDSARVEADPANPKRSAAEIATAQQQQPKMFVLVGTEQQFIFLQALLRRVPLGLGLDEGAALVNWILSAQEFKQEQTKSAPKK